jgi:hypothetical protein
MIWEIGVFILTLLYLATLWIAYSLPAQFFWISLGFAFVLLVGVKIIAKRFIYYFIPILLTMGSAFLMPLIDSPAQQKAFIVLSTGVFYLAILGSYRLRKYEKDQTAKAMINLAGIATLFCCFSSSYGYYLNYDMSVWLIMSIFAFISFLVSYSLITINQLGINRHQVFLYSIFLAYLSAGVVWMQDFWPFGYLTTSVVALIIYYSGWDLVRNHFLGKLTAQKTFFSILFLSVAVAILLLSARWFPVV